MDQQSNQRYHIRYTFRYQVISEGGNLLPALLIGVNELINKAQTLVDLNNPGLGFETIFRQPHDLVIRQTGHYHNKTYEFPNKFEQEIMQNVVLTVIS